MNSKLKRYAVTYTTHASQSFVEAEGYDVDERNRLRFYVYDEDAARDYLTVVCSKWKSIRVVAEDA